MLAYPWPFNVAHRSGKGRRFLLNDNRWRYDRLPGYKPGNVAQKVLIHLDSRTVAMEVGNR